VVLPAARRKVYSAMQDLSGMTLGPYRIIEQIGRGGMATVFRAFHAATERSVAIKVMPPALADDPTFIARFDIEAKVIASLQHVHILPVFDYGHDKGITYLVMPYITGGTLKGLLSRVTLSLNGTNRLFGQLASAVDYAHKRGILHRDLKPANVLLDSSGNVLLSDFGLAKMNALSVGLTGSGILGTPLYMAPEQGSGEGANPQSDIYALGVILYEMVTGEVPYNADTPVAIILKHIQQPLPLPRKLRPDLPEAVEQVILKAMAKDSRDRYETALQMADALDRAVRQAPSTMQETPPARPSNDSPTHPQKPATRPSFNDEDARTARPDTPSSKPGSGTPPSASKPRAPLPDFSLDDDDWGSSKRGSSGSSSKPHAPLPDFSLDESRYSSSSGRSSSSSIQSRGSSSPSSRAPLPDFSLDESRYSGSSGRSSSSSIQSRGSSSPSSRAPLPDFSLDESRPGSPSRPGSRSDPRLDQSLAQFAVNMSADAQRKPKPGSSHSPQFSSPLAMVVGVSALLALGLGLVIAGLASQQPTPTPRPTSVVAAPILQPTLAPTLTPAQIAATMPQFVVPSNTPLPTNTPALLPVSLRAISRQGSSGTEYVVSAANLSPGETVSLEVVFGGRVNFDRSMTADAYGIIEITLVGSATDERGVYEIRLKRGPVVIADTQILVIPPSATPRPRATNTPRPTSRPTATRTSARATSAPRCTTAVLRENCRALVFTTDRDGLRLRRSTSTGAEILESMQAGTVVTLLDGPIRSDGYTWWRVRSASGRTGYSVQYADGIETLLPLP